MLSPITPPATPKNLQDLVAEIIKKISSCEENADSVTTIIDVGDKSLHALATSEEITREIKDDSKLIHGITEPATPLPLVGEYLAPVDSVLKNVIIPTTGEADKVLHEFNTLMKPVCSFMGVAGVFTSVLLLCLPGLKKRLQTQMQFADTLASNYQGKVVPEKAQTCIDEAAAGLADALSEITTFSHTLEEVQKHIAPMNHYMPVLQSFKGVMEIINAVGEEIAIAKKFLRPFTSHLKYAEKQIKTIIPGIKLIVEKNLKKVFGKKGIESLKKLQQRVENYVKNKISKLEDELFKPVRQIKEKLAIALDFPAIKKTEAKLEETNLKLHGVFEKLDALLDSLEKREKGLKLLA